MSVQRFFISYIQQHCAEGRSSILLFPAEGRLFNHFPRELDERSSFVLSSFPRQGWRARRQSQPCAPKAHPLNVDLTCNASLARFVLQQSEATRTNRDNSVVRLKSLFNEAARQHCPSHGWRGQFSSFLYHFLAEGEIFNLLSYSFYLNIQFFYSFT